MMLETLADVGQAWAQTARAAQAQQERVWMSAVERGAMALDGDSLALLRHELQR
jgi:hypothetical protein